MIVDPHDGPTPVSVVEWLRPVVFIFDRPKQMSFWMRNTHIPLDIGFLTKDGVLREVYPLYPFDETSRKSIRSDLLYALEVNQGWFDRHGVKPGDSFDLAKIENR